MDGERLTPPEILGFFQLLVVGGQETTVNLISNAMLCFLEHPDQLARLRAAPDLLPAADDLENPETFVHGQPELDISDLEDDGDSD